MPTRKQRSGARNMERAITLLNSGDISGGRALLAEICASQPRNTDARMALGVADGMLGNYPAAEDTLKQVIALVPGHAGAWFNLGKAQQAQNRPEQARDSYLQACRLQPDNAGFHNNLGNVLRSLGEPRQAQAHLLRAVELEPGTASYQYNLGHVFNDLGLREQAAACFRHAVELDPALADARSSLGNALLALGRPDAALAVYEQLLREQPGHTGGLAGKASVLNERGDFEAAAALLEPCLTGDRPDTGIVATFSRFAHHVGQSGRAIKLTETLIENPELEKAERARLSFTLGYLYDRDKQYDKAFPHYARGNTLRRAQFSIGDVRKHFTALVKLFSPAFMADAPRANNTSEVPVFIIGMPRSGTSLVEQILASHSRVHGAGELSLLGTIVDSVHDRIDGTPDPAADLLRLLADNADSMSARYLDGLAGLAPQALRITDKMPANFIHLGLIELLFPGARVIHCRRNPLDTCLSCYFQDFSGDLPYANDLATAGQYYLEYERLMRHWRSVLRLPVLEVDYESLVTGADPAIQELVDFCDLDWDPACLDFYRNRRVVVTSSSDQVRQPLYTSSIGRWRHYEEYIEPLRAVLESGTD